MNTFIQTHPVGFVASAILVLILVLVPIFGSLILCVPKWWQERGKHTALGKDVGRPFARVFLIQVHPLSFDPVWNLLTFLGACILYPFLYIFLFIVAGFRWYITRTWSFIEQACPYTDEWDRQRFNSMTNNHQRTLDFIREVFTFQWRLAP